MYDVIIPDENYCIDIYNELYEYIQIYVQKDIVMIKKDKDCEYYVKDKIPKVGFCKASKRTCYCDANLWYCEARRERFEKEVNNG